MSEYILATKVETELDLRAFVSSCRAREMTFDQICSELKPRLPLGVVMSSTKVRTTSTQVIYNFELWIHGHRHNYEVAV